MYRTVYRHPFVSPGLGVRILGKVKKEFADLLREAVSIFIEELRNTPFELPPIGGIDAGNVVNWYEATSEAFAVFLPVKSFGVMGDGRTYEYVVALRAALTLDFIMAQWTHLPQTLPGSVSNRLINDVHGINCVVMIFPGSRQRRLNGSKNGLRKFLRSVQDALRRNVVQS